MTARKDDVVLTMGPYVGREEKVWKKDDELVVDDAYGKHLYVRTDQEQDGKVVFDWRGLA